MSSEAPRPFVHRIRPRYGEVDMQGVVFNAHWLGYFDDAMTRFFESLGFDPKETFLEDWDCMLVHAEVDWKGAAGWEDSVDIAVTPVRLGNASFDIRFDAAVGERPVCSGTLTYVSITRGANESCPIPDAIRSKLEARQPAQGG